MNLSFVAFFLHVNLVVDGFISLKESLSSFIVM